MREGAKRCDTLTHGNGTFFSHLCTCNGERWSHAIRRFDFLLRQICIRTFENRGTYQVLKVGNEIQSRPLLYLPFLFHLQRRRTGSTDTTICFIRTHVSRAGFYGDDHKSGFQNPLSTPGDPGFSLRRKKKKDNCTSECSEILAGRKTTFFFFSLPFPPTHPPVV